MRIRRTFALVAAAALLAACGAEDDPTAQEQDPGVEAEADGQGAAPDAEAPGPDPNELVTDGTFRGEGVVLPIPDGWQLDQASFTQGQVVAIPDAEAQSYLAAQAADTADLGQDIDFDELVDANRGQGGEETPTVDEEVDLVGAARAHQLRFEELSSPVEGQPDADALIILAEDGDGLIAIFQYIAPSEEFDEDLAQQLREQAGFDPDSEPTFVPPTNPGGAPPAEGDGAPGEGPAEPAPEGDDADADAEADAPADDG